MSEEKCECGEEHATADDMTAAMNELEGLINRWTRSDKLSASDVLYVFTALLVQWAEEQDDPTGAIQEFKDGLDRVFETPPEERSFVYVESN